MRDCCCSVMQDSAAAGAWSIYGGRRPLSPRIVAKILTLVGTVFRYGKRIKLVTDNRSTFSLPLESLQSAQTAVIVEALDRALTKLLTAAASARSRASRIMERRLLARVRKPRDKAKVEGPGG
jgi:hypothetical protein